jgi:hypothetical protein
MGRLVVWKKCQDPEYGGHAVNLMNSNQYNHERASLKLKGSFLQSMR